MKATIPGMETSTDKRSPVTKYTNQCFLQSGIKIASYLIKCVW
jgi:hypothetical protein